MIATVFIAVLGCASHMAVSEAATIDGPHNPNAPKSCTTKDGRSGFCVRHSLCDDNKDIITDGTGHLTPKKGTCGSRDNVPLWCCSNVTKIVQPTGCGVTNVTPRTEFPWTPAPDFPWLVAIFSNDSDHTFQDNKGYVCAGTIIRANAVLTAAHCTNDRKAETIVVKLGDWYLHTSVAHAYAVKEIVRHPHYDESKHALDMAILFTVETIEFTPSVAPICLPPTNAAPPKDSLCFSLSWYRNGGRKYTYVKVNMAEVGRTACEAKYEIQNKDALFTLHKSLFCAVGEGDDNCVADGGAPYFCSMPGQPDRYVQYGIATWVPNCYVEGLPDQFTNVPVFRGWIDIEFDKNYHNIPNYEYQV